MKKRIIAMSVLFVTLVSFSQNKQSTILPKLSATTIKQVVAAMTLEEKARLVVGTGMRSEGTGPVIGDIDGRVPGAAGSTASISRLGVPTIVLADGPAGVRIAPIRSGDKKTYYGSSFPIATLLASTWNTDIVKKVGIALGTETKEYGVDVILAPAMNIHRNPLNGRNGEYYSEDPVVSGFIAAAMVQGIQSTGTGTSIKHFAANNQESNRRAVNSIISERALREIYLRSFEIAIKQSNPWTVMSAYNKINGTYTPESHDLLTKILRNEWGFKGIVMTDWRAGKDIIEQQKAGNDLIEPGNQKQSQAIIDAVNSGKLDEKVLNQNVERILNFVVKTSSFKKYQYSNQPDLKAHASIGRKAAEEGFVLLKNETNTLPLEKGIKIALYGCASYDTYINNTGSSGVKSSYNIVIADGLANAGYSLNDDVKTKCTDFIQKDKIEFPGGNVVGKMRVRTEYVPTPGDLEKNAQDADVAIYTIGRISGEGADREVENNFNLTAQEKSLIKNLADAFHAKGKKLIILMNIGSVIETTSWKDNADAILLTWAPGQEGGTAIANVISGIINPSGKLATTFPLKYEDVPSSKCFPGTPAEKPTEVVYEEGIYVGYRYNTSFGIKTSFPFGFGLSYTSFNYSDLTLSSVQFKNEITVSVKITNTGKVAGKEVVQLYLSAPSKSIDKPAEELKGFVKTELIQPGASQIITFKLFPKDLASFITERSAWVADAGNYSIKIGASSEDIKLTKSFNLEKDLIVEKVNKALVPQVTINELKKRQDTSSQK